MCGITAIIARSNERRIDTMRRALDTLTHRGPDDYGLWEDDCVLIGHRRLSIVGINNGHQPLVSPDGSIIIACNGELYNYKNIREALQKDYTFQTESDNEILIPLYLKYGIEGMMRHLIGEFAFVLYDKREKTLYAVRDRFGIKPLCWYHNKGKTIIASKAKAIMKCGVKAEWDNLSLMQSISMHYQATDRTLFASIRQIPPGHMLICKEDVPPRLIKYWDVNYPKDTTYFPVSAVDEQRYIDEIHDLLYECVKTRLISDVPICCHLSGGIDSSTIAGMMRQMLGGENTHCFSIVFSGTDTEYDEDALATKTVEHLGATIHKVNVSQQQIIDNLSDAVYQSEGLAVNGHLSCKYLLNKAIKDEGFKVALTGEGADECLAGYSHLRRDIMATCSHSWRDQYVQHLYNTNLSVAGTEIPVGNTLDCSVLRHRLGFIPSFLSAKASIGFRMYEFLNTDVLHECRQHDFFRELLEYYDVDRQLEGRHPVNQSLYFWIKLTLCNYILGTLGDGCEMASSIEGRLPFLDHRLFEYAASLPMQMKIKGYVNEKYILKEAAKPYITDNVYKRQKHPFQSPPLTRFFSKKNFMSLRDELTCRNFIEMGIFDSSKVAQLLEAIPSMSVMDQIIYEPVVMLMLTINHLNNRLIKI